MIDQNQSQQPETKSAVLTIDYHLSRQPEAYNNIRTS